MNYTALEEDVVLWSIHEGDYEDSAKKERASLLASTVMQPQLHTCSNNNLLFVYLYIILFCAHARLLLAEDNVET